jgi:hypothetical protein
MIIIQKINPHTNNYWRGGARRIAGFEHVFDFRKHASLTPWRKRPTGILWPYSGL